MGGEEAEGSWGAWGRGHPRGGAGVGLQGREPQGASLGAAPPSERTHEGALSRSLGERVGIQWGDSGGSSPHPVPVGTPGRITPPHHSPTLPVPLLSLFPPPCPLPFCWGEGRGEACDSGTFLTWLYPFFPHLLWGLGWGSNHLGYVCRAGSSHRGANRLGRSWGVIGMCQITAPVTWGAPSNNFSPGVSQIPSVAGFSLEPRHPPRGTQGWGHHARVPLLP